MIHNETCEHEENTEPLLGELSGKNSSEIVAQYAPGI
jgi:hypothetical protein